MDTSGRVHELRTYSLVAGRLNEFSKLMNLVGEVRGDRYGKLEAHWVVEPADQERVLSIRSFSDLRERSEVRVQLARDKRWLEECLPRIEPLILSQENTILVPVVPLVPPIEKRNVYQLRFHVIRVGQVKDWLARLMEVLSVIREHLVSVALWFTEIGQLNQIVHLVCHRSLQELQQAEERLSHEPRWHQFLNESKPLEIQSRTMILHPLAHSPLQ